MICSVLYFKFSCIGTPSADVNTSSPPVGPTLNVPSAATPSADVNASSPPVGPTLNVPSAAAQSTDGELWLLWYMVDRLCL